MESNNNKITDVFGLAPYGDAIKLAVEKGFDGASAFLSRICLPAAGELGLMFQDKVRYWRLNNIIKIVKKAESRFEFSDDQLQIHPRVIHEIMDEGSWCENDNLQNMWAGILSASCSPSMREDSNLLYINCLKQLSTIQASIINHICKNCLVEVHKDNLVTGHPFTLTISEIIDITGISNIEQLDTELDSLRAKDLIQDGGFVLGSDPLYANLEPTAFLLQFFIKTQGFNGFTIEYYNNRIFKNEDLIKSSETV